MARWAIDGIVSTVRSVVGLCARATHQGAHRFHVVDVGVDAGLHGFTAVHGCAAATETCRHGHGEHAEENGGLHRHGEGGVWEGGRRGWW